MDSMSNNPLDPKNVEYLLPPEIFEELFSESISLEENQSRPDNGNTNIVNGLSDGVPVHAANSADSPSTHAVPTTHDSKQKQQVPPNLPFLLSAEGSEQKVAPMQQTHTWAQIVKKEPLIKQEPSTNTNGKLKETEVPESTTPSVKNQTPKGKGSSQNVKAEQSGSGRKRSGKNKQGHQETNSSSKGKKK